MDDILRSINCNQMEEKFAEITELHSNLKFTMEVEEEGSYHSWICVSYM